MGNPYSRNSRPTVGNRWGHSYSVIQKGRRRATSHLQRQSVSRVPLQNAQVPARVPRSIRPPPGRPCFLPTVLLLVPKLCTESAFWFGAWCIKLYAPRLGRYFWSALSRENGHWMKLFGDLETDSGRASAHFYAVPLKGRCVRRRPLQRAKDSKTGPGQLKTRAVSGAARLEV